MATPFKLGFEEKPFQVYYMDAVVFIATADVTNYLTGQLALTLQNRNGWNTAQFTLANAEDTFVWTQEQALTIRNVLENGGSLDQSKFRMDAKDFRYSESVKFQIAQLKSQGPKVPTGLNFKDKETGGYRWDCNPNTCIFNKFDPMRVFVHNPLIAEQDMTTPAWIPVFAGFLENRVVDDEFIGTGPRHVTITAHDIRYFLHRMRLNVNIFVGMYAGNPIVEINDVIFRSDIDSGTRFGHPLFGKKLEDIAQSLILGGIVKTDANGLPIGKPVPPRAKYTGVGNFRLGQIVSLKPAPIPTGGAVITKGPTEAARLAAAQAAQLTPDTAQTAKRDKAISDARKKFDAAKKAQTEADAALAAANTAVTSGAKVDAAKESQLGLLQATANKALAFVTAAASELAAAAAGTSTAPSASAADARAAAAAASAAAKNAAIPEPTTELEAGTVALLEDWYGLGLFGDWEADLRKVAPAPAASTPTSKPGPTGASGGQGGPGAVTQSSTPNPPTGSTAIPTGAVDSVTGFPITQSGPTNFGQQSGRIPATTQAAQQTQARAGTGAGTAPPGDPATSAGPATRRPLTYKEVLVIGAGTFWSKPFSPDTQKLYLLLPEKGTGNANFADTTTGQNPVAADRSWITRHEVIVNTLSSVDYQWWVSGSGDMFIEPNMCDFLPEDFGQYASTMKVERHLVKGTFGEEMGDVPTAVQATGGHGLTNKGVDPRLGLRRGFATLPLFTRKFGVQVEARSYPFVASKKVLEAIAMTDLQKALAHANQMDFSFGYRPFLLPNKPLYNRVRTKMGTSTAVSHTLVIHREATTRATLDWVRSLRADSRFVLITGGFDAPVSGRRILPTDTIFGPPRTGARTSQDVVKDPAMGISEANPSAEKNETVKQQAAVETK